MDISIYKENYNKYMYVYFYIYKLINKTYIHNKCRHVTNVYI